MQLLEVSGVVRLIYRSLGVKGLMTVTGGAASEHQTAVNISASHQQTTVRPYFYFLLTCLNSFANQTLVRNTAEPINSAHSVALEATHTYLGPQSHHT